MPTPSDPGKPHDGPSDEPVRVLRPRSTDALAELFKEFEREEREGYRSVIGSRPTASTQEETREFPSLAPEQPARPPTAVPGPAAESFTRRDPVPRPATPPGGSTRGPERDSQVSGPPTHIPVHSRATRRTAVAIAVAAAVVVGFGGAVLLVERNSEGRAASALPSTSPPVTVPTPPARAPASPGVLGEGDEGPEVTELQERLLRVPDVYRDGSVSGRYDATLSEAVARFQLWYGVQGDETGVYGDDTRRALVSRTG